MFLHPVVLGHSRLLDRETVRQRDRETDSETERETHTQTHTHRERERERERERDLGPQSGTQELGSHSMIPGPWLCTWSPDGGAPVSHVNHCYI